MSPRLCLATEKSACLQAHSLQASIDADSSSPVDANSSRIDHAYLSSSADADSNRADDAEAAIAAEMMIAAAGARWQIGSYCRHCCCIPVCQLNVALVPEVQSGFCRC